MPQHGFRHCPVQLGSASATRMGCQGLEAGSPGRAGTDRVSAPSSRTTTPVSISLQGDQCQGGPYDALLLKRDDAVLDPETIASHAIGKHHVREEPVADNGDLAWARDASLRVTAEILHDLGTTARFLGLVRKDLHPCGFLKL